MSRNNKSNNFVGLATGVAVVGGALIGSAYYLWDYLNNKIPPHTVKTHSPPAAISTLSDCSICQKDLRREETVELACSHRFHKLCMKGNYIMHLGDEDDYCCPVCHTPVSQESINGFVFD